MSCSSCGGSGPVPARPVRARQTAASVSCGTMGVQGVGGFDPSLVEVAGCQVTQGRDIPPGGRAFADVTVANHNGVRAECALDVHIADTTTHYARFRIPPEGLTTVTVDPDVPMNDGTYTLQVELVNKEAA